RHAARAAARVRRRASGAVWLLRARHPDRAGLVTRAHAHAERRRGERCAGRPPVPLWRASANAARCASRRAGAGDAMISPSLERNPDLDTWLRIDAAGTVTVFTGKVEFGQGIKTALARIAADELDVALARVRVHTADTAEGPNELFTVGSNSLEE